MKIIEALTEKILIKLFSKDYRMIAIIIGVIGFFTVVISAGMSDGGAEIKEVFSLAIKGTIMALISFAYIFCYEYIWSE